jgi:hypothetical protein
VYFRGAVLALNGDDEPPLREAAKTLSASFFQKMQAEKWKKDSLESVFDN